MDIILCSLGTFNEEKPLRQVIGCWMKLHNMSENKDLIQSLCDLEIPSVIHFSPNRQKVLYSTELTWGHRKGKRAVSTLWLATTGQANSSRQITSSLFKDYAPAWHPNGESVAFISDRAKAGEKWALYMLPLKEGGEAYPITATENEEQIEKFAFSPDGGSIAFLSPDEKTTAEKNKVENGEDVHVWGEDWAYARLRIVDVETKEIRCLNIDRHVIDLCWSPNGQQIGFVSCNRPDIEERYLNGSVISTVDIGLVAKKDICKLPKEVSHLTWANNGKLSFCTGVPVDKACAGQGVYATDPDLQSLNYEKVAFGVENDARSLINVYGEVIVSVEHRLESRICLPSEKVLYSRKEELQAFDVAFTVDEKEVVLAVATSNVSHPVEVYTTTNGGDTMVQLSNHGKAFKSHPFGTCSFLSCPSTDNEVELDAMYLTPASDATMTDDAAPIKPLPTVVLIHGGPTTRLTNAFNTYYYMFTPYLLSLGYGVLLPNYRGSSGRGEQFASYSLGGVCKYDYADIIALTQHSIEQGYADKENLLVAGWSQGGLLTFLCSVRNGLHDYNWTFKASVPGAAISDSDTMALTSDLGSSFQPEIHHGRVVWNMDRDDTRNRTASPLWEFNDAMQRSERTGAMVVPPMLILHGEADARCHVTQSFGIQRALQSRGLSYELVTYPRQGHTFTEQKFWIDMALRIGRWCDMYIGSGRESAGTET